MAWNRDLISAQKRQLSNQFNQTHDEKIMYYITCLDAIIDFENYQHFYQSNDFKIKRQDNINTLYLFESFLPDIEEAYSYDKFYTPVFAKNLSTKLITEEEILAFTNDFFRKLDKELYNIFLTIYKHRHDNFQKSSYRSSTFTIEGLSYSYLNVEETKSIDEYISATHEYGHAIQDRILYRNYKIDNYPFHELLAFFSEYLSLLYYEQLHPEDLKDIKIVKHSLLFTIFNHFKKIIYYYNYFANYDNNTKLGMIINMKKINGISFQESMKTIESSLYESFLYSISFLTLIELLYTEDLEKSIYIVKKLIELPNQSEYINNLANEGIILARHLKDFINYTKKNHDPKILHI